MMDKSSRQRFLQVTIWSILTSLGAEVQAQSIPGDVVLPQYEPVGHFCMRTMHRSTIVGNTLFVDGGEWTPDSAFQNGSLTDNGDFLRINNEHLWTIDLSSKFDTSKPGWEAHPKVDETSKQLVYSGSHGTLWNIGDGGFHTVGGWFSLKHYPDTLFDEPYNTISENKFHLPDARLFGYQSKSQEWTSTLLPEGTKRVSFAAFTASQSLKVGYNLGGQLITEEATWEDHLPGPVTSNFASSLTQYDFNTQEWSASDVPSAIGYSMDGNMHVLERVGKKGVIVFFGGLKKDGENVPREMDVIHLYDIDSKEWYLQAATGTIPGARALTCTVVVPAPDLSSYQIYLFAGKVEPSYVLDLYVLTIPSFEWVQIPLEGYPDEHMMGGHSCNLYKNRQMLVVPGEKNVTTDTSELWHICEPEGPITIFDTYEWKFKSEFDPGLSQNKVPPTIVDLIGGNESEGKATKKAPNGGWDDPALGQIFKESNEPPPPGKTNPSPPGETNSPENSDGAPSDEAPPGGGSEESSTNVGAIAGGTVGGVLVIIAVGVFFFLRRRKASSLKYNNAPDGRAELAQGEVQPHYYNPYNPVQSYPQELEDPHRAQPPTDMKDGYYAPPATLGFGHSGEPVEAPALVPTYEQRAIRD